MAHTIVPTRIRLDVSNICQLRCPHCHTAQGKTRDKIGSAYLDFQNFRRLADENPNVRHIEISHAGEIFLNPDLVLIMEYAFRRGIALTADSGVNLNTVSKEALEALVKYRVRSLFISIDGFTPEIYRTYRKNGDLNRVIENIRTINYHKRKHKSRFPFLVWQFIVFDHNRSEISDAKKTAYELNMGFLSKPDWNPDLFPGEGMNEKEVRRPDIGNLSESLWVRKLHCGQLWHGPQVSPNGKVLGCCMNISSSNYGNVFESGLEECINGEKMQYARAMVLGKKPSRSDIPCSRCLRYIAMNERNTWLSNRDIWLYRILGRVKNHYIFGPRIYSMLYDRLLKRL